jgi:hypothetical protein
MKFNPTLNRVKTGTRLFNEIFVKYRVMFNLLGYSSRGDKFY